MITLGSQSIQTLLIFTNYHFFTYTCSSSACCACRVAFCSLSRACWRARHRADSCSVSSSLTCTDLLTLEQNSAHRGSAWLQSAHQRRAVRPPVDICAFGLPTQRSTGALELTARNPSGPSPGASLPPGAASPSRPPVREEEEEKG